jgi:hypothetical protein
MIFWKGIVVDIMDPLQAGRVRVRILGKHTPDPEKIPNDCLPWASVIVPCSSGLNSGVGISPNGMTVNSIVLGYFDDEHSQQPIVIGVFPRPHFEEDDNIQELFGLTGESVQNGFKDLREDLEKYPVRVENITYNLGEDILIENKDPEKYPREDHIIEMSPSFINSNIKGIEETLVETKRKTLQDGGILEKQIRLAIYPTEKYEVVPNVKFSDTNKAEFIQYSEDFRFSSDIKSTMSNYKAAKEENRINSDNKNIYGTE